METAAHSLTLAEFRLLPDDGRRLELDAGEAVEMPPATHRHSQIVHALLFRLYEALKAEGRFEVRAETAFLLRADPATVRVPDLAIVSAERLRAASGDGYLTGAPEVAVEVVSPSETATDLNHKIRQYLAAGAAAVVAVYPKTGEIHVYRAGRPVEVVAGEEELHLPEAVANWTIRAADIFAA